MILRFMQAYSVDLRQRIVDALSEERATIDAVARRFCVSSSSVKRYKRQLQETGSLSPKPWPGRALKIKADQQERLREMVASRTDWTLQRLCDAWHEQTGVCLPFDVMARTLARLKITYKKRAASPKSGTKRSGRSSEKRYRR
jgi:transposase